MVMYLELQNEWPFFNIKSSFFREILHHFCIFNRKFRNSWHLNCNSQYFS